MRDTGGRSLDRPFSRDDREILSINLQGFQLGRGEDLVDQLGRDADVGVV